ncbi:LLM class flavin-dependent oxidoreductase [Cumulibacter manganitolerans]|uniref:LLM class flavin-dependent oxidoreductase n=1 Tax=Cumulibacter manganitolerans TaxID=1884992 RepID=UPI001885DB30|nr:LLM class flavin-dependent oxidoreductase [Cumulibacter manganitolerans]
MSLPVGILDFVAISGDATAGQTVADTVEVAQTADRLGYHRYWVPEHHNHLGLAFTSQEVLITRLLAATERIRVGAAGIMLPNWAPLKVAEVFRTLETIFPGRADLGLGRAPGTDGLTAHALRNGQTHEDFPQQCAQLLAFLYDSFPADHPYSRVVAAPIPDQQPEIFMLGSSDYGPTFAAVNGLIAVFAHHMSPQYAAPLLRQYRERFEPSPYLDRPHAIVSTLAFATDEPDLADAALATWMLFKDKLQAGERGPRASLDEALEYTRSEEFASRKPSNEKLVFAGRPDDVAERLQALVDECAADELVLISPLGAQQPRLRSFEALAGALGLAPRG